MSSLTNDLQELYEDEQALTKMLKKRITRLEHDLDVTKQDLEATKRALNGSEDQLEYQTERLSSRDAALLDLQMAFNRERSQHDEELGMLRRDLEELLAVSRNSIEAQRKTFKVWQHGGSRNTLEQSWGLSMSALNKEESTASQIERSLKPSNGDDRKADMVQGSKPSDIPGNPLRVLQQTQGVQFAGIPYTIPQRREKPSHPTTKCDTVVAAKTPASNQPVMDDGFTVPRKDKTALAIEDLSQESLRLEIASSKPYTSVASTEKRRVSPPGTSEASGNLPLESARQRERDIFRTILYHDLARVGVEVVNNLHDNEVVSAPLSDPALLNEPLSSALAMGLTLTKCLAVKKVLKRSDPLFTPEALRNMRCAVKVSKNPVMGNPFSPTPGWDLKVDLNPRVPAQSSVAFHFCFSKDEPHYKNYYDHVFSVGWEPCLKVEGRWMMKDFDVVKATTPLYPEDAGDMFPTAIQELCTNQEDLDRLYCAKFRSHVQKSSEMSPEWAEALRGDKWKAPYENLQLLCTSREPVLVLIWFLNPLPTVERLYHGCLAPLCNAVKATDGESVQGSEEDSEEALEATE